MKRGVQLVKEIVDRFDINFNSTATCLDHHDFLMTYDDYFQWFKPELRKLYQMAYSRAYRFGLARGASGYIGYSEFTSPYDYFPDQEDPLKQQKRQMKKIIQIAIDITEIQFQKNQYTYPYGWWGPYIDHLFEMIKLYLKFYESICSIAYESGYRTGKKLVTKVSLQKDDPS